MSLNRVVVTGMGAVSPFGKGAGALYDALLQGKSGVRVVEAFDDVVGLRCRIGGVVPELDVKHIPRQLRRSMSRLSIFAYIACQEALSQAGVNPEDHPKRLGVAMGSTVGSPQAYQDFFADYLKDFSIERTRSTFFFKVMGHTAAANVSQSLGITGRVLSPTAACASSVQALGLGFESVALGKQDMMLCGGADELHPLTVSTFDIINAASTSYNDCPSKAPRPFDKDRDGTVCSEGGGVLLLESLESAKSRGAPILGEIFGYSTVADTSNISNPDPAFIADCMHQALDDAGIASEAIDYVNAHATATASGDIAESEAIHRVFGESVPVSCFKGHLGHALAASGALECVGILRMLEAGTIIPTRNLDNVEPACAPLNHVRTMQQCGINKVLKNNFALGGVNATLILGRYMND